VKGASGQDKCVNRIPHCVLKDGIFRVLGGEKLFCLHLTPFCWAFQYFITSLCLHVDVGCIFGWAGFWLLNLTQLDKWNKQYLAQKWQIFKYMGIFLTKFCLLFWYICALIVSLNYFFYSFLSLNHFNSYQTPNIFLSKWKTSIIFNGKRSTMNKIEKKIKKKPWHHLFQSTKKCLVRHRLSPFSAAPTQ